MTLLSQNLPTDSPAATNAPTGSCRASAELSGAGLDLPPWVFRSFMRSTIHSEGWVMLETVLTDFIMPRKRMTDFKEPDRKYSLLDLH